MIIITNPTAVSDEINTIHSLFDNGLEFLHIRKPDYSETEMILLLTAIRSDLRNQLVLHSHHYLANEFGITHIHFTKKERSNPFKVWNPERVTSTSTHSIEEFNTLRDFEYAFLSPVYPSISKPGYETSENLLKSIKNRTNFQTKLVALGGISAENIAATLKEGFDEVALLGTIWNSTNPIKNFKKCQQNVRLF